MNDLPERKAQLYLQHPEESPELIGVLPYLIHPPSKLSSTASWVRFRDKTLLPMIQHRRDDPNLPNFLKPDFQYIFHPGGGVIDPINPFIGRIPDAAVVALRTAISF